MLVLDGSHGEGGGQILRSALGLALVTGTPFRIENIRAGRPRPGLMRQHVAACEAAAALGGCAIEEAVVGARTLTFRPRGVHGGQYRFAVETAGSATLVLQTVLPALLLATAPSHLILEGGTHNPSAPPFDFLARVFLPLVNRLGPHVSAVLERPGFYPAGGGRFVVDIQPAKALRPLSVDLRGPVRARHLRAVVANLARSIGERELDRVATRLGWSDVPMTVEERRDSAGPGNVVMAEVECAHATELFTAFGQKGMPAEAVADELADEVESYLASEAPVGPHLSDQLLVPLALAGGGGFVTGPLTPHALSQIALIPHFLDRRFDVQPLALRQWRVTVV